MKILPIWLLIQWLSNWWSSFLLIVHIHICSVIIYVHIVIIQCTQHHHAYSHYSAATYVYTVLNQCMPHCIVTMCSLYTVSLCSVNTVSLISLKLYSVHSVTIHAYYVIIQCTHCHYKIYPVSLYSVTISVHISPIKYAYCNYTMHTFSL